MPVNLGSAYGEIIIDGSEASKGVGVAKSSLMSLGGVATSVAAGMAAALAGAGIAIGAALTAVAVSGTQMAADMESQMSDIQSVMGATADEVGQLKELILDLGVDPNLKVSATEAAQAIEMLGKNGLTVTEILEGAAEAVVLLSNATGGDFALSADIATDVMALWNIEAKDMMGVVDQIAAVVTNSKFSIDDFALALAQGGGVAAATGVSLEEFTAVIAGISPYFASGSDAGTSFKTMLQKLAAPTDKAIGAMGDLGLYTAEAGNAFFDAEGNLKNMGEVAGLLEEALADLSEEQRAQALTTIFGADAIRAAAAMAELGAEGFRELSDAMAETDAAEMAATRMDNLRGALEILGGIIETIKIKIGEVFIPIVRQAVEGISRFVEANQDTIIGFFERVADVISAFLSGAPGDFPWEDIFPPWLAGAMYDISAAFENVRDKAVSFFTTAGSFIIDFLTRLADGEGVLWSFLMALEGLGIPSGPLNQIREFGEWVGELGDKIVTFVTEHAEEFKGALVGIGAALAGSAIAALIAGIGSAIAALATPVTALIAAAALLGAAWAGNWFGMRDAVTEAWERIQPALNGIRDWFQDFPESEAAGRLQEIGEALAALARYFGFIIQEGDPLNDWLTHLPEAARPFVKFLGEALATVRDTLGDMAAFFQEQGGKIGDWFQENGDLIRDFAKLVSQVIGTAIALYVAYSAVFIREVARAWAFVGPILEGIIDLALGLAKVIMQVATGDWKGAWETIKETAVKVWDSVKDALRGFADWVTGWFGTTWEGVRETWRNNWELFKEIVSLAWENIKNAIAEKVEAVRLAIEEKVNAVKEFFSNAWTGIKETVSEVWEGIKTAITEKIESIRTGIEERIAAIQEFFTTAWETIRTGVAEKIEAIRTTIRDKVNAIQEFFTTAWENIKNAVLEKLHSLFELMGLDFDEMSGRWQRIWEDVRLIAQIVWDRIVEAVRTKIDDVKSTIDTKVNEIKSAWQARWDELVTALQTVWTSIVTAVTTRVEETRSTIDTKVNEIKTAWETKWNEIKTAVEDKWREIVTAVTNKVEDVRSAIDTKIEEIKSAWETKWNEIKTALEDKWDEIVTAVEDKLVEVKTEVEEGIENTLEAIREFFRPFLEAGQDLIKNIIDGIIEFKNDVINTVTTMVDDAVAAFRERISSFIAVGGEIISNIISGLAANVGQLVSYITGIVESIVGNILASIGGGGEEGGETPAEASGAQFVQDIVDGMMGGMNDLVGAGELMGMSILDGFTGGLQGLLEVGQGIGGFLSGLMGRYEEEYLDPLMDQIDTAEHTVDVALRRLGRDIGIENLRFEDLTSLYINGSEELRDRIREIWAAQERRNGLEQQYIEHQERLLEIQRQQEQIAFLQQQMDLLELLAEHGLNAAEILDGITLGLDANLEDLVAAMQRAMQAIIEQAEQELEIGSPSKVFRDMFQQVIAGAAEGLRNVKPVMDAARNMYDRLTNIRPVTDIADAIARGLPPVNIQPIIVPPPAVSVANPLSVGSISLSNVTDAESFLEQMGRLQTT